MRVFNLGFGIAVSLGLGAGAASAEPPVLPTFGHYIGYGQVMSVTPQGDGTCSAKVGQTFTGQLELNTPANQLEEKFRQVSYTPEGPVIVKERFFNTGTNKHQVGTVAVEIEELGPASRQTFNYTATATPLDLNSFNLLVTIDQTDATGTPTCTETDDVAFIRSSAD